MQDCTIEELLSHAEVEYIQLGTKWVAATTDSNDTGFFSGECFKCGKKGHRAHDCYSKVSNNGGGSSNNDKKFTNYGNKGGRGGGQSGRGGKGGGRGGRGGDRATTTKADGNGDKEKDPFRQNPKSGESHEKTINGKKYTWCGRCARWGDHSTEQHRTMLLAKTDESKGGSDDDKDDRSVHSARLATSSPPSISSLIRHARDF